MHAHMHNCPPFLSLQSAHADLKGAAARITSPKDRKQVAEDLKQVGAMEGGGGRLQRQGRGGHAQV